LVKEGFIGKVTIEQRPEEPKQHYPWLWTSISSPTNTTRSLLQTIGRIISEYLYKL
jgi:hypothetical protein